MRAILPMLAAMMLAASPAAAQLMLPGTVAPAPAGSSASTPMTGEAKPAPPPPVRAPGEDTIVGRELRLNGSAGLITFDRQDKDLRITRLTMPGNQISRPADICRVDVSGGPFLLKSTPRVDGLLHFQSEIESCPIAVDVLDGAVRVSVTGGLCSFASADCKTTPGGVWGPPGTSIGPAESKNIERLRAAADKNAQAYYKALIATAKDKAQTRQIAAEQAGFSSKREEACRDYAKEDVHGFCASRLTEARAVALRAKLYPNETEGPARKPPPPKRKPAPVAAVGDGIAPAPAPIAPHPAPAPAQQKSIIDSIFGR